jgi:hypothetical protein
MKTKSVDRNDGFSENYKHRMGLFIKKVNSLTKSIKYNSNYLNIDASRTNNRARSL